MNSDDGKDPVSGDGVLVKYSPSNDHGITICANKLVNVSVA